MPIPHEIVDQYLSTKPTTAVRWAAQGPIRYAVRCFPDRFEVLPSQRKLDPHEPLLTGYLQHLRDIRGLQMKTCEGQLLTARRMLAWQREHLPGKPISELTAKHVLVMTRDLLSACCSDGSRSCTTAYMRSLLRYLYWENLNTKDLAQFVPRTPCWRQAHLPQR